MKSAPDREFAIFTEALKLSSEEREAFLERECVRDKALRQRLEALLRAHKRLGNFLEEPPTDDPSIERN